MGETAVNGAETPRYIPRTPSFRSVLDNIPKTELLAVAVPPVCILTLTRSRGCPTRTQHAPPTPPEMKDLRADSDLGASFSSSLDGDAGLLLSCFVSSFVADMLISVVLEEVVVDMVDVRVLYDVDADFVSSARG